MRKSRKKDNPHEFIVHFIDLEMKATLENPQSYSKDDRKFLDEIVETMSKDIWIDKSYSVFHGNYYKDMFIPESVWKRYNSLVDKRIFSKKELPKDEIEEVQDIENLIVFSYMMIIISLYGYDVEDIDLEIDQKKENAYVEYYYDRRTRIEEY